MIQLQSHFAKNNCQNQNYSNLDAKSNNISYTTPFIFIISIKRKSFNECFNNIFSAFNSH